MAWYKLNEKKPKIEKPIILMNTNNSVDELARYSIAFLDSHKQIINCETGVVLEEYFHKNFKWRYIK